MQKKKNGVVKNNIFNCFNVKNNLKATIYFLTAKNGAHAYSISYVPYNLFFRVSPILCNCSVLDLAGVCFRAAPRMYGALSVQAGF